MWRRRRRRSADRARYGVLQPATPPPRGAFYAERTSSIEEGTLSAVTMDSVAQARSFDEREYRTALGSFASGVTVITTDAGPSGPIGFTCQSFYSVSLDPPLVSFSVAHSSRSRAALRPGTAIAVNFLGAQQQHLSAQFARSGTDKWRGVAWQRSEVNGAPVLDDVTGWVAGRIEREIEAGDHVIFLVAVEALSGDPRRDPLLFFRGDYRALADTI